MNKNSYFLVSLGCAKNTVDSQSIEILLGRAGFDKEESPDQAEVLIVNTCGFIKPAREESKNVLKELAEIKE